MGLTAALHNAGRSLEVYSAAIQVAGHNIANATTPGYVRETLALETAAPTPIGNLILGTGVNAGGITQQIDLYLEGRIHSNNSDLQGAAARLGVLQGLEGEIQELGTNDFSTALTTFFGSLQELSAEPGSVPLRQLVINTGKSLAEQVASFRNRLDTLSTGQDTQLQSLSEEANTLIDDISRLNRQIVQQEQGGNLDSDAGGLRTQRYDALNRLSEIIPIDFQEYASGEVSVFSGSDYLVLGSSTQHLETYTDLGSEQTGLQVRLSETQAVLSRRGGEIGGIIQARDQFVSGFTSDYDTLISEFIFEFNKLHSSGEGSTGFESITAEAKVTDTTAALSTIGLPYAPENGSFQLKVTNTVNNTTTTTDIEIDLDGIGTETSLEDLRASLDAVTGITATISTRGELELVSDSGFEFGFANDTSGVLASLGINTFFTGSDSGNIGVNQELLNDPNRLAVSQGGGPGDNRNLLELVALQDATFDDLNGQTLDEFYQQIVGEVAQTTAGEAANTQSLEIFQVSLTSQRTQYSGVSLDEETLAILDYQHAFEGSARVVQTVQELFDVLLNL